MNYTLAVLTHGDNSSVLHRTLSSFAEHVTPRPSRVVVWNDGPLGAYYRPGGMEAVVEDSLPGLPEPYTVRESGDQRVFCDATRSLWWYLVEDDRRPQDYVFWLEHDFEFTHDVNLHDAAGILDRWTDIAQVALMRDAVNEQEKAAGGLYESRRGEYVNRDGWLEHRSYLTTNPMLMRREFMVENPWPDYDDQCEGRFGIDLLADGYRFAVLGDGKPWVRHIGVRDGFGY